MLKFQYTAFDAQGRETSGEIEALDLGAATSQIKERGVFPIRLQELGGKPRAGPGGKGAPGVNGLRRLNVSFGAGRVRGKLLTTFTRQLATLLDAGMPLLRGLRLLDEQERHPVLRRTVRSLAESIEGGATFSESLARHPRIFTKLYVNMVRAGEAAGALEVVLNRLAEFQEKSQKIKSKVLGAMVYPSVVLGVSGVIVGFLLTVVVPKFQVIFTDLLEGQSLPVLTLALLAISRAITRHALVVLAALAACVFGIKLWIKTRTGRYVCDVVKLRLPVFGQLVRKVSISRFTRTLGTLVSSGVPILQALLITRDTTGNQVVAHAVDRVHDAVREGESIVQPLRASKVFPPMVVGMIGIGEETGALPEMLMKIADNYDDEVDNAVAALTSVIEPVMIVLLALVIGTIVIALFLPMIEIISTGPGGD
jgi:type IV pilus assembly protein PilC